jgi:hypothetical protein
MNITNHSPLVLNGQNTAGKSFSPLNLPAGFYSLILKKKENKLLWFK